MNHGLRIHDLPVSERPRERLAEKGAEALTHAELIAILLRTGLRGRSAIEIAQELLQRFGSLNGLERASLEDLQKVQGIKHAKAIALKAAFTLARRMAQELHGDAPLLDNPASIADYLREEVRGYEVEHFHAVLLNTRRKLIRVEMISQGLVDTILVHPREVFKRAIAANASALVLVHNHPRSESVRGGHQGDARFDPRRPIAKDRSAGPRHPGPPRRRQRQRLRFAAGIRLFCRGLNHGEYFNSA